jgi:hypothetical protein
VIKAHQQTEFLILSRLSYGYVAFCVERVSPSLRSRRREERRLSRRSLAKADALSPATQAQRATTRQATSILPLKTGTKQRRTGPVAENSPSARLLSLAAEWRFTKTCTYSQDR